MERTLIVIKPEAMKRHLADKIIHYYEKAGLTSYLEDLGFYCIDNVPAALLATMIGEIAATSDPLYANLAIGIDARNRAADLARLDGIDATGDRGQVRVAGIALHRVRVGVEVASFGVAEGRVGPQSRTCGSSSRPAWSPRHHACRSPRRP
mgnify:CR=1 FL=1